MNEPPLLETHNLGHSFGEGPLAQRILQNISIQFQEGEIVMIIGPSGSGKTTFLSLVGALRVPREGSIRFNGREISGAEAGNLVFLRRDIGFIFQSHNLIASLTACENVQLPFQFDLTETAASSRAKAMEVLRLVGLEDHAHKIPSELSGGQKQRVAVARAIARRPKLILADEPTASLDRSAGREVVDILQKLSSQFGCTILVVTHDHRILDIADRVLLLEDGGLEDLEARLERLLHQVAELFQHLSRRLESMAAPLQGEPAGDAPRFEETLESLDQRVHNLIHLKTRPALTHRMELLQRTVGQMRLFHTSVLRFGELLGSVPPGPLAELADRLFQALHALLLTASDAFRDRDPHQIEMLQLMTQDRREIMTRIRDTYFGAQKDLPEEAKVLLFELTNAFTRAVYLLNSLAALQRRPLEMPATGANPLR